MVGTMGGLTRHGNPNAGQKLRRCGRFAVAFDLWGRGRLGVELRGGATATVTVRGPGLEDRWTWKPAPDERTASEVQGRRRGRKLGGISSRDTRR